VLELADDVDEGRSPWGFARGRINDREVLIAAIRRALADTEYAELSREAVDELLLRAQREGLLELARVEADDALDPDELRASEITGPAISRGRHRRGSLAQHVASGLDVHAGGLPARRRRAQASDLVHERDAGSLGGRARSPGRLGRDRWLVVPANA
jgi:hypothetical protein